MESFGDLIPAIIGLLGTLLSALLFLIKRWMSGVEEGQTRIREEMREGFTELRNAVDRDYLQREQHMQLHGQLQDAMARMTTRLNGHDALLEQHGERLSRLEREWRQ